MYLLRFGALKEADDNLVVNSGTSNEDIIHGHGCKTLSHDLDMVVLLKPFVDLIESVPAATIALIEEASPDAAGNEGTEVDPSVTVILERFISTAVGDSRCIQCQLGNEEGELAFRSYAGLIASLFPELSRGRAPLRAQ